MDGGRRVGASGDAHRAFAEEVVVDESPLAVVPGSLSLDVASLLSCGVLTGVGAALDRVAIKPGASVVVDRCQVCGSRDLRLACEAHRGGGLRCDARPRPDERDPAAELRGLTEGRGADFVFVTVGRSDVIERAIGYTRRGGTVVVVGTPPSHETFGVVAVDLVHDDVRIVGSKIGSGSGSFAGAIARLVRLYEDGRLKLDELVTARYPLARINDAIAAAHGDALRNVIVFDRE